MLASPRLDDDGHAHRTRAESRAAALAHARLQRHPPVLAERAARRASGCARSAVRAHRDRGDAHAVHHRAGRDCRRALRAGPARRAVRRAGRRADRGRRRGRVSRVARRLRQRRRRWNDRDGRGARRGRRVVVAATRAAAAGAGVHRAGRRARRDRARVGRRAAGSRARAPRAVGGRVADRPLSALRHARARHAAGPREPPPRRARAAGPHAVRDRAGDRGAVLDRRRRPHRQRQRRGHAAHRVSARRTPHQARVGAADGRLARALARDLGGRARGPSAGRRGLVSAPRRQRCAAGDVGGLRRVRRPRMDQRVRA